jgi:hypothetical protein
MFVIAANRRLCRPDIAVAVEDIVRIIFPFDRC